MGFFQGIYGFDFLSIFLLLLTYILNIWPSTRIIGTVLFIIIIYRTLSKNIYKRQNENYRFCSLANKLLSKLGLSIPSELQNLTSTNIALLVNRLIYNINQMRKFKTVICPGCHKKLKLPRGRGKVIITCKTCKTEFKAKV